MEASSSKYFVLRGEDLSKAGFYRTKCYEHVICCGCGWQSDNGRLTLQHLNFLHKVSNPDCKMCEYLEGDYNHYFKNKQSVDNTEKMMRETFLIWPKPYPRVEEMLEAGFYYTGAEDAVSCISCGVILDTWKPEDSPMREHRKASPHCEFVQ